MARVPPLRREDAPELEDAFRPVEERMGFLPNSLLTMARRPEILRAVASLAQAARTGSVSRELKELLAFVASTAAGCRYCQAHTASNATRVGADTARIASVWRYETSELFSPAERAALRLAHHAALVPNQATEEDFEEVRRYFDDGEIVEIVAIVALFGFLNRWNDTMATDLELRPFSVANEVVADTGWEPGKHSAPHTAATTTPSPS
jgi:uncharacterized peroxidase-related enzyme